MELAHYLDRLQIENDELRKMMGWLSGHEPHLRMMIKTDKRYDGEALGANKVGEESAENEGKIGDILEPPRTHHKNAYTPKPNLKGNGVATLAQNKIFPAKQELLLSEITGLPLDAQMQRNRLHVDERVEGSRQCSCSCPS
jgi:hypothetical protein